MRDGESFGERILWEMLENITGKETYMNEMARKLRDASVLMKGALVNSTYAISLVRKALDAGSTPTFAGDLGAVLDVIADELDALEDKAERRRSHIVQLESTIAERNRELRELRGQLPTDKERQILDMWPRFEDGEPVMFGDEVEDFRGEIIEMYIAENASAIWNNFGNHMHLSPGERVKRPGQSVLDAGGVEIKVGDTVWIMPECTETPGEPYRVKGINKYGEVLLDFHFERSTGMKGEYLTHTRPDSWERLEEDTMKSSCAYFGFASKPCSDGDGCPANKPGDCAKFKAVDIVRRAKALAGVEADA